MALAPAMPLPFQSFFSTGRAWGRVALERSGVTIHVAGGCLELDRLLVTVDGTTHDLAPPPVAAGDTVHLPL